MNLMFSIICSNVGYALNSCCCFHLDGDDEDDEDDNDDDMKCCSQTMNVKKSSLIHKNFMVFGKSKKKKKTITSMSRWGERQLMMLRDIYLSQTVAEKLENRMGEAFSSTVQVTG